MESNKVNSILMLLNDKLDTFTLASIKTQLEKFDDGQYTTVMAAISDLKSPTTMLIISLFLGQFGVDRFMLGKVGSGICKLIFGWLTLGIWWLVDVIKVKDNTKKYNGLKLQQNLMML